MGLFDSSSKFYQSFTPPSHATEQNAINPMLWGAMSQGMSGKPTPEDWQWFGATERAIQDQYANMLKKQGFGFAGRGVFDSGWQNEAKAKTLGAQAGDTSNAMAQMFQNAINRQMQYQGMTGDYLAGARAGSGTYTYKG